MLSGLLASAGNEVPVALQAHEKERYLRNRLLAPKTPDTFREIDWLYRGIDP